MKKIIALISFCFFGLTQMNAQVTFRPGLRGGVNFSRFTKSEDENEKFTSKTDFYFGGYGAIKLSKYYTLQPEIVYSRQGTYFEYMNEGKTKIDVSYLSFGVVNKFTFINKFNVHVGPTLDFQIEKNNDVDLSNNFDLALMLGAGYDFTDNFGVEARIKQGLIPMSDGGVSSETNVVYQLGINYTFDIK